MAFSLQRILRGISIFKEGVLNPGKVNIISAGDDDTTTTINVVQTDDRTLYFPDNNGTILSTGSEIALTQLAPVTADKVLISNEFGIISASATDGDQLQYLDNVTSDIQTQIDDVVSDVADLQTDKANVTLNNILPVTAINVNGQKITNAGTPTVATDLTTKDYVDNAVTGGGANRTLSNLDTPTAINESLIPDGTLDLGNSTDRWDDIYGTNINASTLSESTANAARISLDNSQLVSGGTTKLDWSGTDISVNTRKITNVSDPSSAQDVATKNYVDTFTAPKIKARYFRNTSGNINSNVNPQIVDFNAQDYDASSTVTTGASWVFTTPTVTADTLFMVDVSVTFGGMTAANETIMYIYKNGLVYRTLHGRLGAGASFNTILTGSGTVLLSTGDTLNIRVYNNSGSAVPLAPNSYSTYVAITQL